MWLNPESFRRWMRPSDADLIYVELHPIPGGTFRFDLREKDGRVVLGHDLPEDGTIFADHRRGWAVILDRLIKALAADEA